MSVSAETVTLFDAAALGCDGSRLYMGGDWSGKTVYNLPADAEQLKSSEEAFVNGNKELRIYSDAFLWQQGDKEPDIRFWRKLV